MNRRRFLSLIVRGAAAIHCAPWLRYLPLPAFVKEPLLDELNAVTLAEIYPTCLEDNFFKATPFIEYLRSGRRAEMGGGTFPPGDYVFNEESSEWEWTDEERI